MLTRLLQNITILTRTNRLYIYNQKAKDKNAGSHWKKNGQAN